MSDEKQVCDAKYPGKERRKGCKVLKATVDSVDELKDTIQEWRDQHESEHKATSESIAGILTAWNSMKGFILVVNVIGVAVKWIAIVGTACGVVWGLITHGFTKHG